ncbi:MAG TPA: hypothetical protein PK624_12895 [Spirochaetota bacterium]|nr:hypothetical protein [Spirochaetota bacterium]HOR45683.1 hypothetical protein [Spirochaetota bacterium]HPK57470.1 hypothetical protein [Spirochaetota bacterium]
MRNKVVTLVSFTSLNEALTCKEILDTNNIKSNLMDKTYAYTEAGIINHGLAVIEVREKDYQNAKYILQQSGRIPSDEEIKKFDVAFRRKLIKITIILLIPLLLLSIPLCHFLLKEHKQEQIRQTFYLYDIKLRELESSKKIDSREYYKTLLFVVNKYGDIDDYDYCSFIHGHYITLYCSTFTNTDSYAILAAELSINRHNHYDFIERNTTLLSAIKLLKKNNNNLWKRYDQYVNTSK